MKEKKRKKIGLRTAASLFTKEFRSGLSSAINDSISDVLLEAATEIKSDILVSLSFTNCAFVNVSGGSDIVDWCNEPLSDLVEGFINWRVWDCESEDAERLDRMASEFDGASQKLRAAAEKIRKSINSNQ